MKPLRGLRRRALAPIPLAFAWFLSGIALAQEFPRELSPLLPQLSSTDIKIRSSAPDSLAKAITAAAADRRPAMISELVRSIKVQADFIQAGVGASLARLGTPWLAANQDEAVDTLYGLYLANKTKSNIANPIDDGLANAAGFYRDAIRDYNRDNILDLDGTGKKFRSTYERFPQSRYADNARFYHAIFLTKAFVLGGRSDSRFLNSSNAIFTTFKSDVKLSDAKFVPDAMFFMAVNFLLLDNRNEALAVLARMQNELGDKDQVYVYQVVFSLMQGTVVDEYLPAKKVASVASDFVKGGGNLDVDGLKRLTALLLPLAN